MTIAKKPDTFDGFIGWIESILLRTAGFVLLVVFLCRFVAAEVLRALH
jgi:F0F1-type ATP synthase membrane subunit b/b'